MMKRLISALLICLLLISPCAAAEESVGYTDFLLIDGYDDLAVVALREDGRVDGFGLEPLLGERFASQPTAWTDVTDISFVGDWSNPAILGLRSDGTVLMSGCLPEDEETERVKNTIAAWDGVERIFFGNTIGDSYSDMIFAVREDGSLLVYAPDCTDEQLAEISGWKDIVKISTTQRHSKSPVLVALSADGELHFCPLGTEDA